MKKYKKPIIKIRPFLSERIITASRPANLTAWKENHPNNTIIERNIEAMKFMEYNF